MSKYQVPLLISSAGGDGSNAHVDEIVAIVQDPGLFVGDFPHLQLTGLITFLLKFQKAQHPSNLLRNTLKYGPWKL